MECYYSMYNVDYWGGGEGTIGPLVVLSFPRFCLLLRSLYGRMLIFCYVLIFLFRYYGEDEL